MKTQLEKITELKKNISTAVLFDNIDQIPPDFLNSKELEYLGKKIKDSEETIVYRYPGLLFFYRPKDNNSPGVYAEHARKAGASLLKVIKQENLDSVQVVNFCDRTLTLPFTEGILLASYSFSKYKKEKEYFEPDRIYILDRKITKKQLSELSILSEAVLFARDLVNEPVVTLTAQKLAEEIRFAGEKAGFVVDVLGKQKISSLKMGGLLAVNRGSIDPPTFSIIEWKPEKPVNRQPIILVGKGVVYDTGGLSLKPTPNSMDYMKSDMGGAATVAATTYALAKTKVPVHIIGLIPATDNRPDGNAYVPGDIITMFDGTTVEIRNTDAEGRLLLADALSYAKKYKPQLVIDVATLTGAAAMITGDSGIAAMGSTDEYLSRLKKSGEKMHERLIELPLWEEFEEPLKSSVADINNLGTREGQASIAGKFLEHFTDYPWIHLDIAGPAFISEDKGYRIKGGTGTGVRLLFDFLKGLSLITSGNKPVLP